MTSNAYSKWNGNGALMEENYLYLKKIPVGRYVFNFILEEILRCVIFNFKLFCDDMIVSVLFRSYSACTWQSNPIDCPANSAMPTCMATSFGYFSLPELATLRVLSSIVRPSPEHVSKAKDSPKVNTYGLPSELRWVLWLSGDLTSVCGLVTPVAMIQLVSVYFH